jgi:hypothetical protein
MTENDIFPEDQGALYGDILPLKRNADGSLALAWPGFVHGAVNSAYNALTAPGETLTGRAPGGSVLSEIPDPYRAANDITGTMMGLGMGTPVPAGSSRIFGGLGAKTADQRAFNAAIDLHQAGVSPEEIWNKTGWFKDVDSRWKFEIPDTGAQLTPSGVVSKLGDVLHHPDLYAAYPELKDTPFEFRAGERGGEYAPDTRTIYAGTGGGLNNIKSTILHETQHSIQHREGFAAGGGPDEFLPGGAQKWNENWDDVRSNVEKHRNDLEGLGISYGEATHIENGIGKNLMNKPLSPDEERAVVELATKHPEIAVKFSDSLQDMAILHGQAKAAHKAYESLAGEVEARNVQERWENKYGKETPPWLTQGYIPRDQQIVVDIHGRPMSLSPVEHHPFGTPVEHNPFTHSLSPIDHDPFQKDEE